MSGRKSHTIPMYTIPWWPEQFAGATHEQENHTMFENVIAYLDQICEKNGEIEIKAINLKKGTYTLIIPVFNGEYACNQIAELKRLEFTYDGDCIDLYGELPRRLLSDNDIAHIRQKIWEATEDAGLADIQEGA